MKHIIEDIKKNIFKNVYLLTGKEAYLRLFYKNKLADAIVPPSDTMNRSVYAGKGIDLNELIDLAQTLPFMAERRLIIVEDSGLFKGAAPDEMITFLSNIPEETVIIFNESEVDKRLKMAKAVDKNGYIASFDAPDDEFLKKWIAGVLQKEKKKIRESTATFLVERVGNDMENLHNELMKLVFYIGDREVVEKDDIAEICSVHLGDSVFNLLDAIVAGNQKAAMVCYEEMYLQKEDPIKILRLLSQKFEHIYQTKKLVPFHMGLKEMTDLIGTRDFLVKKYLVISKRMEEDFLLRAIEECAKTDYYIKSGRMEGNLALELIIVSLIKNRTGAFRQDRYPE
ncbi:MAG: DNA polymerase III subunit delta [Lachnospiraceae bacterium]|nr:DNA polymerase III subunit delta [Lachnospiraceae bacterium]